MKSTLVLTILTLLIIGCSSDQSKPFKQDNQALVDSIKTQAKEINRLKNELKLEKKVADRTIKHLQQQLESNSATTLFKGSYANDEFTLDQMDNGDWRLTGHHFVDEIGVAHYQTLLDQVKMNDDSNRFTFELSPYKLYKTAQMKEQVASAVMSNVHRAHVYPGLIIIDELDDFQNVVMIRK